MADQDNDAQSLTADICLLTTALGGHREDDPVQSRKLKHGDPAMLTLYHVATLLTTGTPSYITGDANDSKASRIVAITANLESTSAQCILVAQNTGMSPSAAEVRPLLLSTELVAGKGVDEILEKWHVNVISEECVLLLLFS